MANGGRSFSERKTQLKVRHCGGPSLGLHEDFYDSKISLPRDSVRGKENPIPMASPNS